MISSTIPYFLTKKRLYTYGDWVLMAEKNSCKVSINGLEYETDFHLPYIVIY